MISVLVLHESALVREALERVLGGQADIHVRATGTRDVAGGGTDSRPHVVVSHARQAAGPEVRDAHEREGARLVVQVDQDGADAVAAALLAGADGLFTDRTAASDLVEAVRHVAAGHHWVSPDLVPELVRDYLTFHRRRAVARRRLEGLAPSDLRLLGLVAVGMTNAEIAIELHLAVSTVKEYVGTMLARLGSTRAEAIVVASHADLAPGWPP